MIPFGVTFCVIPFGVTFCVVHFGVTFWCYLLYCLNMPDDLWPRVADAMHAGKMESRQGDNLSTAPRLSSFSFFENLSFLLVYHVILAMGATFYFYLLSFNFFAFGFYLIIKTHICFFLNILIWPTLLNNASVPLSSLVIFHLSANKKLLDTG